MTEKSLKDFMETTDIKVSAARIEEVAERMVAESLYSKASEEMNAGNTLSSEELENLETALRDEAYEQAKTQLVLEELVKQQGFEVSEEEITAELEIIAKRLEMPLDMVRGFLGDDLKLLKTDILIKKAINYATEENNSSPK